MLAAQPRPAPPNTLTDASEPLRSEYYADSLKRDRLQSYDADGDVERSVIPSHRRSRPSPFSLPILIEPSRD